MPAVPPATGPTRPGGGATDAARAAFFRAALGQVQAAPAPARTAPTAPAATTATTGAARAEPLPDRPSRPGSLLDIRV
jgi:hypothetical protein